VRHADGNIASVSAVVDDLEAPIHRPVELAAALLGERITAVKIWPLHESAATFGQRITADGQKRVPRPTAGLGVSEAVTVAQPHNLATSHDRMVAPHGFAGPPVRCLDRQSAPGPVAV
jgi:hypothetical protein